MVESKILLDRQSNKEYIHVGIYILKKREYITCLFDPFLDEYDKKELFSPSVHVCVLFATPRGDINATSDSEDRGSNITLIMDFNKEYVHIGIYISEIKV